MNSRHARRQEIRRREHRLWRARDRRERTPRRIRSALFHDALNNVEAGQSRSAARRVGGAHLPGAGRGASERAQALAIRWLITAARSRTRRPRWRRACRASCWTRPNNRGNAVKKREEHAPHGRSQPRLLALPLVRPVSGPGASRSRTGYLYQRARKLSAGSNSRISRNSIMARSHPLSSDIATSASWRTSTPARRPRPSGSSITPASPTRSAKSMTAPRRWTGWSRSRSAGSRSRRPRPPCFWKAEDGRARAPHQHHRHPRPRRLHHRGRAFAARARRRGRRVSTALPASSPQSETRVAPGRQVQRAADVLHQQARPHRRRFLLLRRSRSSIAWAPVQPCCYLPIGAEERFQGPGRPRREPRDHLEGRVAGRRVLL